MYKFRYALIAFAILVITLALVVGSTATLSEDANTVIFQIYNAEIDYPIWTESYHDIGELGTGSTEPGLILPIPDLDEGDYYLEIIIDGERYGDLIAFSGREGLQRIMSSGDDSYDIPSEPGDIMDDGYILRLGGPDASDITHVRGMLGIGTDDPSAQLHTTGSVRFAGAGIVGDGKVLTSDAEGNATWQVLDADNYEGWRLRVGPFDPYLVRTYDQVEFVGAGGINVEYEYIGDIHTVTIDGMATGGGNWAYSEEPGHEDDIHNLNTGNVGIGTTTPSERLDVDGLVRIRGGDPGEGKVLTSDAAGVATWEDASHTLETLTRGTGLTGDDYDGSSPATWSVDFAGSGSATTVARSDHYHEVVIDPCGAASVVDVDGNSYETVRIGDQCWFSENLRTTKYRDGTSIPHVMDGGTWGALVSGAYCEYNNDPSNVSTYGRIYNWYAVDDARGLCPTGWRVANHDDWTEIRVTLGMSEAVASSWGWHGTDQGSKLGGEYDLWNAGDLRDDPTFGSSGFNAIPGGLRQSTSPHNFAGLGNGVWIWHATENSETHSWFTTVYFDRTTVGNHTNPKRAGKYVRCIMEGYDGGVSASEFIRNQNAEDQAADFRISGDGYIGGNVGIGTTTPEAKLDVHGDINLNQNQAKGLVIENRTEPPATPVPGQIWFIVE